MVIFNSFLYIRGYPHCFKRRPAAHGGRKHPTYHDVIGKLVQVGELLCAYIYIPICSMLYGIFTYICVWKYDEICPFSIDIYGISIAGWWFQTWILFSIIWMDNPSHWLSYYSRLLKPPTSIFVQIFFNVLYSHVGEDVLETSMFFFLRMTTDAIYIYIYVCVFM